MTLLLILSAMFIGVGVGTICWQSRAKTCPVHNRMAGKAAGYVAFLSISIGIALLVLVILLRE